MSTQPMTERFEMRLGQSVLERLDAWRGNQSDLPSRSETVRRLVEAGLDAAVSDKKIKLSDGNKLILVMLCELFKQLKLKTEIDPEFVEAAINGGHLWAFEWEYPGVFHWHEDDRSILSDVVDVMDMWSFLESGFAKLSRKDKDRVEKEATPFGKYVSFSGFDGNNEGERLGIARFLIDKLHRFSNFKGRELNSHMPTTERYRRMFAVFEPIRRTLIGRELDGSEIIEILKAGLHPDRRKPELALGR
jgi:uncharacterized protein YfbU (UPF0304 family)